MQDPKTSQTRTTKPWYQKAIQMATLWRTISNKPSDHHVTNTPSTNQAKYLLKSMISKSTTSHSNSHNAHRLRKCTSLKVATSFTRVCLCAPISSYNEVLRGDIQANIPPRRSYSYPRSKPNNNSLIGTSDQIGRAHNGVEVRRFFRGKSLTDDVLMRRFVVEEEAMMQVRRRNQMEIIRKRNFMRRKKLGPSPLSRMVMAENHSY